MAEELLRKTYQIRGRDFDKAGETATEIKQILKGIGINSGLIHRTVVIAFEAEMNVVMYASEGTITFVLTDEDIKKHYDENKEDYKQTNAYKVRQIMLSVRPDDDEETF